MVAFIESLTAYQLILTINYLLVVVAMVTVILKNENPTTTLSYIIILIVFPFFGLIVYYLFGQEYRKQKIFNRKNVLNQSTIKKYNKAFQVDQLTLDTIEEELLDVKVKLIKLLNSSEEAPLTRCNEVEVIRNGENVIPKIVSDILEAKTFIHLEYYIVKDDETGVSILDAICKKAAEGVTVKLIYDYVGSSLSGTMEEKLRSSGVEFYPFMPVYFPKFTSKMNYRDHRKIAIIDGLIGYVGGVNISNTYFNGRNDMYWRDTHLRIVGQAIGSLQMHFFMTWDFVTEKSYQIEEQHFPKCTTKTKTAVQIAASGPDTDWANIMEAIFSAINLAEKYVYITTPYFIPNDEIITALVATARSGVDVRILTPQQSDSWIAKHASASYFERLLEANVRIFYYQKGFVHAKTIVVDDVFATVGTSNMDYRSFNINFEINALMYSKKMALTLKSHFEEDLQESEEVFLKEWKQRGHQQKLAESLTRLLAPLL